MLKKRFALILGFILLGLAIFSLGLYLFQHSQISIGETSDEGLSVRSHFPQADCQKTISAKFPFVRFKCEEKLEPEKLEPENSSTE